MIRLARADDLPRLAAVERSAGERFRGTHMDWAAAAEPTPLADLEPALARGELWVAEADGELVGFLLAQPLDDSLYIREVAVALDRQGQGLGRALIAAAAAHARQAGHAELTLTTDELIAWNRPFYERLGFRLADYYDMPPGLFERLRFERDHFPPSAHRCAMRLAL
jgi:GNAT superfamily N-acetyltransferase